MKKKLNILYEDKNILIINKPAKVLTVATSKEKEHTLYQEVSAYVKKQYPKNKIFIVNRLDKDTSGIVVFAKNEQTKQNLQKDWKEKAKVREYIAIVEGKMKEREGTRKNYLYEDKTLYVHETDNPKKGELAITHYQVLQQSNKYSLVKIIIETGKKNQIRVHLKGLGNPIIGDKKYGATKNPLGRLGLHATYLELEISKGNVLKIECPAPKEFYQVFGSAANEKKSND